MSYSGLNGVARNFPCQRTKFRVCHSPGLKKSHRPQPMDIAVVCQWKSVIQRSGYGKLSPKHNLHTFPSLLVMFGGEGMGNGGQTKF